MTAQIFVHPVAAGDPALIEAIQTNTRHIAAHYKGKVLLIPRCKVDMQEIVRNLIRGFANETQQNA